MNTPIARALTEVLVQVFENDREVDHIFRLALPELEKRLGVDTPQERLTMAAALIDSVLLGLDLREATCTCCTRVTYSNWPAKMAGDSLGSMPMKLRRFVKGDPSTFVPPPLEETNGQHQSRAGHFHAGRPARRADT